MIIYVDDCLMIGSKEMVEHKLGELKKIFSMKHKEGVDEFIGCTIKRKENQLHLSQPALIRKLMNDFKDTIDKQKIYSTPAAAGVHVLRSDDMETKLNEKEQKQYRSTVGSFLYLLKHSRPDLSNIVREL